jgi:hypothetical protein
MRTVYLVIEFVRGKTDFIVVSSTEALFTIEEANQMLREYKITNPQRFFAVGKFDWSEWSNFA